MIDESDPVALKALQDDIYREKVLRARALTPTQRLDDALELSDGMFHWMHAGAMHQLHTTDEAEGWKEVERRLKVLRYVHGYGYYRNEPPAA